MHGAAILALTLAATAAPAWASDPLQSSECTNALGALAAEEDAVIAARHRLAAAPVPSPQAPKPLLALRRDAARACLGAEDSTPAQPVFLRPSLAAPRDDIRATPAPQAVPGPMSATPPPARPAPLVTITGCDTLGCWASDGTRLQQQGPNLLGPRGTCTRLGTVLSCP